MQNSVDLIFGAGSPYGQFLVSQSKNSIPIYKTRDQEYWCDIDTCEANYEKILGKTYLTYNIYYLHYNSTIFFQEDEILINEIIILDEVLKYLPIGAKVNIFFASSISLYSSQNFGKILKLSSPIVIDTIYKMKKRAIELYLKKSASINSNLNIYIFRIPCLVGNNARHNFLSVIFNQIKNGHPFSLSNIDDNFNSVTDFETLYNLSIFLALRNTNGKNYYEFNVGCKRPVSLRSVFKNYESKYNITKYSGPPPRVVEIKEIDEIGFEMPETMFVLRRYYEFS